MSHSPLSGDDWTALHVVESRPAPTPGEEPTGGFEGVGRGYFDALGLPLLAGRTFTATEAVDGRAVVVINEAAARRLWQGRDPVGDRIRLAPRGQFAEWHTVVGVVGAARYEPHRPPRPRVYVPERRLFNGARERDIVVRTGTGQATAIVPSIRAAVLAGAPDQAIGTVQNLEDMAARALARPRLQTLLLATFGLLGLALGAVGVYGVVNYNVAARTRDIGIRLALGARGTGVLILVLRRALAPVLTGLAVGLLAALAAGRLMAAALFDADPHDPAILAGLSALLLLVATVAAAIPARRTLDVDPVRALRAE